MIELKLKRMHALSTGIFSELQMPNGTMFYTCEHAYKNSQDFYEAKIPVGTYTCVRGQHRLEKMTEDFTTFEVTGVPGHTNILFHRGNYNQDSDGCILLGQSLTLNSPQPMIGNSRIAFFNFMNLLDGIDAFTLTVS